MEACLQNAAISNDKHAKSVYDLRYFYVKEGRGFYTSGVAFESMLAIFRERRFQNFNSDGWYTAVSETGNPIVKGYIAEQICINKISAKGLPMVDAGLTMMEVTPFSVRPAWNMEVGKGSSKQASKYSTVHLYVPTAYNFPNIDAVILALKDTSAHIVPIQVTLSRDHKDSEEIFYKEMWQPWTEQLENAGFTVSSTFVWIGKGELFEGFREEVVKSTRQGARLIQPEHRRMHIPIRMISRRLATALLL